MSSVPARYEVSGERRKPNPSDSTSSAPSPQIGSPLRARLRSSAKTSSCLRSLFAPSTPASVAICSSSLTCRALSSDKWSAGTSGSRGAEETSSPPLSTSNRSFSFCGFWGGLPSRLRVPRRRAREEPRERAGAWSGLDVAVNEGGQLRFGKGAHFGRLDIATLEQHQRRNAANAILGGRFLVIVDVELGDLELAGVILGDVVQDRGDHLAGATPFGPVIDQHRGLGLQHFGFEVAVGHIVNMLA